MSDRTRVLRYKRSALASMGAQEIMLPSPLARFLLM